VSDWSDEEADNALYADHRNFYKVEKAFSGVSRWRSWFFLTLFSVRT
jgi:hypothetical protein